MGAWRVSQVGRVLLAIMGAAAVVSVVAPPPWSTVAGLILLFVLLLILSNTFVGRTVITMSDRERTEFFRRLYGPKRRPRDP